MEKKHEEQKESVFSSQCNVLVIWGYKLFLTHMQEKLSISSVLSTLAPVFLWVHPIAFCVEMLQISYSQTHLEDPGLNQYK